MSCASWSKLGGGRLRRDCPELELTCELEDWAEPPDCEKGGWFCATKCYYSSLYIYVRTGVIAFARFLRHKTQFLQAVHLCTP